MDKASKYKSFTLIEPSKSNAQYWQEVWYYRYLVFYIAIQKIMVRYKQTVLGIFWALLNPFITMVVLSLMWWQISLKIIRIKSINPISFGPAKV